MARRLFLLAALAGIAIALAAVAQGGGPPNDKLTGSGKIAFTDFPSPGETTVEQISISAHSGPNGENPRGSFMFHSPFADSPKRAEVTCLVVNGNHAVVGAIYEEPLDYFGLKFRHISLIVTDTGKEDTATGFVFLDVPRPPGFSPCNAVGPTDFQVVQGNYVVNDG